MRVEWMPGHVCRHKSADVRAREYRERSRRYERPTGTMFAMVGWVPVVALFGWWRWPYVEPVAPPTKQETVVPRSTLNGHYPPPRLVTLPEEVVLRALDLGRPAFVHCFKRAIQVGTAIAFKIRVRIEFNATGKITSGTTDAETPALGNCLLRVAYGLPFGSPTRPAVAEFPLFYRE